MRLRPLSHAALAALLLAGCTQNAILELQVLVPPGPTDGDWFAVIQVRDAVREPFDALRLVTGDRPVRLTDEVQWVCTSVESTDPTVSANVRVRFCRGPDCTELADAFAPERLYTLETPFYIGARTYYRIEIDDVPICGDGTAEPSCVTNPGVCLASASATGTSRCGCVVDADCGDTSIYQCVPEVGCVENVGRCFIEGCIGGPVSASFCSVDSGRHFCEASPQILRDETFACSLPE